VTSCRAAIEIFLIALAMLSTAILTKPSAAASALIPADARRSRRKARARASRVERLVAAGPKTRGKWSGRILPSTTLQSVTVSGPPRR
jgi:hypothetical protein